MKRFLNINISLFVLISLFLLSGCSGEKGGDPGSTSRSADSGGTEVTSLTGAVADGYLAGAWVFLDRNSNRVYDNGEPRAQSTAGGRYTLAVNPGEGELYPVVVQVVAGQTVDEDSGTPVANGYLLESLPGHWDFISPLTTLVKLERDKNPSLSEQQIEIAIRSRFGIADSVSLFSDYLTPESVGEPLFIEYSRAHKVAQIIAEVMGRLTVAVAQNIGGQIADDEQLLVAYMIADQILDQAELIEQALNNERNSGTAIDISALITAVSAGIDIDGLNSELLARYEQRLEQHLETWDMQPPQLQSQSPPADDTASVAAIISVEFDEPLDETLLTNGILELSGPNGSVAGSLNYDAEHFRLTFTPGQLLLPFSSYQVTVLAELADALGNPLGQNLAWTFTTIFDQLPPALPDF